MNSPIFIIGTERSGSNLLRLMLNEHPSISIPHPPHILKEMAPLEHLYGDLNRDANFRRLVADTVRLVELHFSPWDVAVDADLVFKEAPGRDIYGVKAAIYDQYCRAKGKKRWGCKSTFVIHYVDRVLRHHPDARFIHLVRDGRDVAVSAKKSVFNHFHPHYVGRLWSAQQRTAMELAQKLPPEGMLSVRYEELLDDPAGTLRRICGFLREDYSDALLRYHESLEAKTIADQSRSWENLSKPVLKSNRAKYKSALSRDEIKAFELQSFAELKHYGYALENEETALRAAAQRGIGRPTLFRYWIHEKSMSAGQTLKSLAEDRNALIRLKKSLFVLLLRLTRGVQRET